MKRTLMTISALLFPWFVLFLYGNFLGALIAALMQFTIIGWPVASIWALRVIERKYYQSKKQSEEEND